MRLPVILTIIFVACFLGWMIYIDCVREQQWLQFSTDHHCHIVGRVEEVHGYSTSGNAIDLPARETWKCDNGYTVTRDAN